VKHCHAKCSFAGIYPLTEAKNQEQSGSLMESWPRRWNIEAQLGEGFDV